VGYGQMTRRRIGIRPLPASKLSSEWSPHMSTFVLFVTRYKFWEFAFVHAVQVTNVCNHHFLLPYEYMTDSFRIPIPIFNIFKPVHQLTRFQNLIVFVLNISDQNFNFT
jgi:hypothetical protein